ncbi:SMI1/KNR4 family protein [Hymenobacter sp. HDW8]|uniref:SMI1/KNR4 family protein n=1 Tax=Hymenobacter sp. HDW8 TaxID=2714932 RepID=UPI00140C370C|nr:SMI1/KNR4 family protein [Hymenobacter sp. HDW8]QIL74544.1 SMI1/KNR4 family protein [Hymenobacter sp. HDW8]
MNNKLIDQLEKVLPMGMVLPKELILLYQWIEEEKLYVDDKDGYRYGFLFPENELNDSYTDSERDGGTSMYFSAGGVENLKYWFGGNDNDEVKERLCVFAQSGAEGSECALWLSDNGQIKVVHMGSGSGSMLSCVLADNFTDFLRLLAIGYDEICWNENFPYPPNENSDDLIVKPNFKFQNWVRQIFNIEIPKIALEIVKHPATMDDESSEDEFFNWYKKYAY